MRNIVYNEDCLLGMKKLEDNSIDLVVTSPPYFNAREYSTWESLEDYMNNMKEIFNEVKRVLKNHKMLVVNISDIIGTTNGKISGTKKLPLASYFIIMLEELGLIYIDDIIWDKGEVQSKRNFVGEPYPFQKYPINCYEHILIFRKFEKNEVKPNCPKCNKNISVINGVVNSTITYECRNPECQKTSKGRGNRYSSRQILKQEYQKDKNIISDDLLKQFRRDIVKLSPVIKINNKGENKLKHTAPYPIEIPNYAISFYSGVNDLILDPFMGSGTTALACINLNRDYIGYEINKDYYQLIYDKINNIKGG